MLHPLLHPLKTICKIQSLPSFSNIIKVQSISSTMATLAPQQIPSIEDDYKSGKLQPTTEHNSQFISQLNDIKPSASINAKVSMIKTSITTLDVTAIVNAANEWLGGGGGVVSPFHVISFFPTKYLLLLRLLSYKMLSYPPSLRYQLSSPLVFSPSLLASPFLSSPPSSLFCSITNPRFPPFYVGWRHPPRRRPLSPPSLYSPQRLRDRLREDDPRL